MGFPENSAISHGKLSFRAANVVKLAANLLQAVAILSKLKIGHDKKAFNLLYGGHFQTWPPS